MCRSGPASDEMQTNQGVASASALLQHELEAAQGRHEQLVEANAEAARTLATTSAKLVDVCKTLQGRRHELASCEADCKASTDHAKSRLVAETERALASKIEELRVEHERRLRRIDEATEVRKRSFPVLYLFDHFTETCSGQI